jgi:hypothetical protein
MVVSLLSLAFGAGSLRLGEIMQFSERIGLYSACPAAASCSSNALVLRFWNSTSGMELAHVAVGKYLS